MYVFFCCVRNLWVSLKENQLCHEDTLHLMGDLYLSRHALVLRMLAHTCNVSQFWQEFILFCLAYETIYTKVKD